MRRWLIPLILVIGAGGWLLGWSPYLRIEQISVVGLGAGSPLTTSRIIEQAAIGEGMPMARVSEPAVRRALLRIPRVGAVDVSRQWPHAITITVHERDPWAVVRVGSALHFVDRDGNFFAKVGSPARSIPTVSLPSRNPDLIEALVAVSDELPTRLRRSVVDFSAVSSDQLVANLLLEGRRVQIVWGSREESALKVQVLLQLLQRSDATSWTMIDLSAPRAPTTRTSP